MILDTSAMVAVLYGEPESALFIELIAASPTCRMSVANFVELSMVVERQLGPDASRETDRFIQRAEIVVEPVTVEHGMLARQAFLTYGKRSEEHTSELQSLMRISYAV